MSFIEINGKLYRINLPPGNEMNHLFGKIKAIANKAIDWLVGEEEDFPEPWIEYDGTGRLQCQPVFIPVGTEGCWVRCDRFGRSIPNQVPSRLF